MSGLEKFDSGLRAIYTSYRDLQARGASNVGHIHPVVARGSDIYIYLTFDPPLSPIEALGFKVTSLESGNRALGRVRLADLEALAAHPAVRRMETGTAARADLDHSIPDIQADKVRTVMPTGALSGVTGRDVIVGIIDTGLDFRHPDFQQPLGTSRVLRIWDQGLKPRAIGQSPDENLLSSAPSYGTEYEQGELTAELQLGANAPMHGEVYHRDCAAHGTHVGSITAGNGREGGQKYIGVAPEADIIAVKLLNPESPPADEHAEILWEKRFKDAVCYVLNTAAQLGKPVVINMSMGGPLGSHDGTSKEELFLNEQFPPDAVGRACVVSAGNYGLEIFHSEISIPAGGEVSVPMKLLDARGEKRTDTDHCDERDNTESAEVQFWYAHGPTVTVAVEPPDAPRTPFVAVTGNHEEFIGRFKLEIVHKHDNVDIDGHTIKRNVITLTVRPDGKRHLSGIYHIVLKSVEPVKIEAWGGFFGERQIMRFVDVTADGIGMPPEAPLVREHRIGGLAGSRGAISVASYAAEDDPYTTLHAIDDSSSRGALLDYSGAHPPPDKPDLAAPGVLIDAAMSGSSCRWNFANLGLKPYGYHQMSGTSMAAPHVAGTVALMLSIKKDLTFGQIRQILIDNTDKPGDLDTDEKRARFKREFGAGRLNVKRVIEAVQALS